MLNKISLYSKIDCFATLAMTMTQGCHYEGAQRPRQSRPAHNHQIEQPNLFNYAISLVLTIVIFCSFLGAQMKLTTQARLSGKQNIQEGVDSTSAWRLIWYQNDEEDSVLYYDIYRNTTDNFIGVDPIGRRNSTDNPDTVYVDEGVDPGIHYYYRLKAVNQYGSSPFSDPADAAIPQITLPNTLQAKIDTITNLVLDNYVNDPDTPEESQTWSVSGGDQITVSIISASRIARVTTSNELDLTESFIFTVTDPDSFYYSKEVVINVVEEVNQSPSFTSEPDTYAMVDSLYQYIVRAFDPDGDTFSFSLTQAPDFLTINSASTTSARVEGTPDESDLGEHTVRITVEDNKGGTAVQQYTLTVTKVTQNHLPSFTSIPVTNATVGSLYQYTVRATDEDGDPLLFSLTQAPAFLTIDSLGRTSALVQGTPAETDIGDHNITIRVDDKKDGIAIQQYTLTVTLEAVNTNPKIISTPLDSIVVERLYNYEVTATDADGDNLSFALTEGPAFLELDSLDINTARVSGTPTEDDVGEYEVTIAVTDGNGGSDSQSYTLVVIAIKVGKNNYTVNDSEVWPIPFNANQNDYIRFVQLPENCDIYIYNLLGELVHKFERVSGEKHWYVNNYAGNKVQSGLYLYVVKQGDKKSKVKKLVITR
jgi:hypothetical protein